MEIQSHAYPQLSEALWSNICSYMTKKELLSCRFVCKRWSQMILKLFQTMAKLNSPKLQDIQAHETEVTDKNWTSYKGRFKFLNEAITQSVRLKNFLFIDKKALFHFENDDRVYFTEGKIDKDLKVVKFPFKIGNFTYLNSNIVALDEEGKKASIFNIENCSTRELDFTQQPYSFMIMDGHLVSTMFSNTQRYCFWDLQNVRATQPFSNLGFLVGMNDQLLVTNKNNRTFVTEYRSLANRITELPGSWLNVKFINGTIVLFYFGNQIFVFNSKSQEKKQVNFGNVGTLVNCLVVQDNVNLFFRQDNVLRLAVFKSEVFQNPAEISKQKPSILSFEVEKKDFVPLTINRSENLLIMSSKNGCLVYDLKERKSQFLESPEYLFCDISENPVSIKFISKDLSITIFTHKPELTYSSS